MKSKTLILGLIFLLSLSTASALDLKEANVMDVQKEGDRFSVTLIHDDSGEEGYANWWQVETMDGEKLGRRTLLHAHGTRNFTRSEKIQIPEGTQKVVLRGHDQTQGYGGRAAIYTLKSGNVEFVDQGPERNSFEEEVKENISEDNNLAVNKSQEVRKKENQEASDSESQGLLSSICSGITDFIF